MRTADASLAETSQRTIPQNNRGASDGPKLAHVTEQPGLPIKFDSKRGCDQIRARLYHDHRLTGLELSVALALSEFVNLATFAAFPKQQLLARMVHATRPKVSGALTRLESKGVMAIDRCRTYCRYVFLASWRGQFVALPGGSRCSRKEHQDVPERNITGEPINKNLVPSTAAAAVLPTSVPQSDTGQQQQLLRIEGLIPIIAVRSRKLGRRYDETGDLELLAAGEIDVDDLQDLADELQDQLDKRDDRRYRRR